MKRELDDIDRQAMKEGNALSFMARNRIGHVRKTSSNRFTKTKHLGHKDFDALFKE